MVILLSQVFQVHNHSKVNRKYISIRSAVVQTTKNVQLSSVHLICTLTDNVFFVDILLIMCYGYIREVGLNK